MFSAKNKTQKKPRIKKEHF